jgi:hypothetical protein
MGLQRRLYRYEARKCKPEIHKVLWNCARKDEWKNNIKADLKKIGRNVLKLN